MKGARDPWVVCTLQLPKPETQTSQLKQSCPKEARCPSGQWLGGAGLQRPQYLSHILPLQFSENEKLKGAAVQAVAQLNREEGPGLRCWPGTALLGVPGPHLLSHMGRGRLTEPSF